VGVLRVAHQPQSRPARPRRSKNAGSSRRLPVPPGRRWTAFAAVANVGYGHPYPAADYTQPGSEASRKGNVVMGDKSPKSVHKKAAQKQLKANEAAQKKQQAAAAKQVGGRQ